LAASGEEAARLAKLFSDKFDLPREERFNKGARVIIHSNRLLPGLSDGRIEIPCYLFRMFWRTSLYCGGDCFAHGEEDFIGGDRHSFKTADANDSKPGTHTIEHLVDALADCRLQPEDPGSFFAPGSLVFGGWIWKTEDVIAPWRLCADCARHLVLAMAGDGWHVPIVGKPWRKLRSMSAIASATLAAMNWPYYSGLARF
jgi:hypothetical protein